MGQEEVDVLRRRLAALDQEVVRQLNERLGLRAALRALGADPPPLSRAEARQALLRENPGPASAAAVEAVLDALDGADAPREGVSRPWPHIGRVPGAPDRGVVAGPTRIGGGEVRLVAGPCAVESEAQLDAVAARLVRLGVRLMRGGAYKPRTSPYTFQGLGREGLDLLHAAGRAHGLGIVTEVVDPRDVPYAAERADVLQIGTRNMYNYELLKEVGQTGRPILLKRGFMATLDEFLYAAEYLATQGAADIVLCERGIRTFEKATRNTLDISAIPLLKLETGLPVLVDVSHAAGRRDLAVPLARAALAAGADGIMVEAHPCPARALSDNSQQLDLDELDGFVGAVFGAGPR